MKRLADSDINTPEEFNKDVWQQPNWFDKKRWWALRRHWRGGRFIDLGCHLSPLAHVVKGERPDAEVWGLDFSDTIVEQAKKKYPQIKYVKANVYEIPFEDNYFDYITAGQLLEHLDNPELFLKEAFRILKPTGILALSVPKEEQKGAIDGRRHLWSFKEEDIVKRLSPYGRVETETIGSRYMPYEYYHDHIIAWCWKKEDLLHIVYTPFTGMGYNTFGGSRGDTWLKDRIKIFKEYTLRSLEAQRCEDFLHWLAFREEDATNARIEQLRQELDDKRYNYVLTFTGMPMWDDRGDNQYDLWRRLRGALPIVFKNVRNKPKKYVYETRLDSDDMYDIDAIDIIQKQPYKENGAIGFKQGYVFDMATAKFGEWNPKTTPPFYTIMFPWNDFFDPFAHAMRYCARFKSHEEVSKNFDFTELKGRHYCVGIHHQNLGTLWNHPFRGANIGNGEQLAIEHFNFEYLPRREYKATVSWLKTIFNYFPFHYLKRSKLLRGIYYRFFFK